MMLELLSMLASAICNIVLVLAVVRSYRAMRAALNAVDTARAAVQAWEKTSDEWQTAAAAWQRASEAGDRAALAVANLHELQVKTAREECAQLIERRMAEVDIDTWSVLDPHGVCGGAIDFEHRFLVAAIRALNTPRLSS